MGPGSRTHVQIPSVFTATTSNVPTRANVSIGPDWNSSNLGPSIVTYNNGPTSIIAVEEVSATIRSLITDLTQGYYLAQSELHGPTGNNIDKPAVDNIKNKSSVRKVWRFICRLPRLFSCDSSSKKPKLSEKGKASESEKNQPQASAPPQPRSQKTHNVVPEQQQLDSSGPSPPEYRETDNIVSLRHANRGPIRFIIDAHGSIFDNGVSSPQTSQRTNGNSDEISSRVSLIIGDYAPTNMLTSASSQQQEVNEIVRDAMRRAAEATAIAQTSFDDAHRLRREILARVQASSPR